MERIRTQYEENYSENQKLFFNKLKRLKLIEKKGNVRDRVMRETF